MGDVKDILNLPQASGLKKSKKKQKKRPSIKDRRPPGVNKEVYELQSSIGMVAPLVPTTPVTPQFKERRKLNAPRVGHWEWRAFHNSARSDGVAFYHWEKTRTAEGETIDEQEYPFAKFDVKLEIVRFTDEQYEQYFANDANWTKEQTQHLFDLCEQFDVRFVVVASRFRLSYPDKTIEDLRDRYYSIVRKLTELAASSPDELADHPLFVYPYNKDHEVARKIQAEKLYRRTREEVLEEESLVAEYRRIETEQRKHQHERKRVLRLTEALSDRSPKRRRRREEDASQADDAAANGDGTRAGQGKRERGVYTRSSKMLAPLPSSVRVLKQVEAALTELQIPPRLMPTKAVQEAYDKLRNDITILVDLQAHMEKKIYDLEVLKAQLAHFHAKTTASATTSATSTSTPVSDATPVPVAAPTNAEAASQESGSSSQAEEVTMEEAVESTEPAVAESVSAADSTSTNAEEAPPATASATPAPDATSVTPAPAAMEVEAAPAPAPSAEAVAEKAPQVDPAAPAATTIVESADAVVATAVTEGSTSAMNVVVAE